MLDELGLELLGVREKKHYVLQVRNTHGICRNVTLCKTPSDSRSRMNELAQLRRVAKLTTIGLSGITPDGGKGA